MVHFVITSAQPITSYPNIVLQTPGSPPVQNTLVQPSPANTTSTTSNTPPTSPTPPPPPSPPTRTIITRLRNNISKPNPKYAYTINLSHPQEPKNVTQALKDPKWR